MTLKLAAVVLTKNEELNLSDCLESLRWADEIIVFDALSTDRTTELAEQMGARVIRHPFQDFAAQRNSALATTEAEWVFFVDADERATSALAAEVRQVVAGREENEPSGWWVPRDNYMIGHRMRGGGWYPDYQLRLLHRGKAIYDSARPVHEIVLLDGRSDYLKNALVHLNYKSVAQFRQKMARYTELEARILHEQGTRVRPWTYLTMPVREFWRRFVKLRGYRDHVYGLLFCGLMAWYTLATHLCLRRLRKKAQVPRA